jgi:hypothetical protein
MNIPQAGVQGFAPILKIGPGNPEAMKYRQLYETEAYRRLSPGEQYVPTFLEQVRPRAGSSVIDFGAGTGRPALALALFGQLNVTMVDFVSNCLDDDVRNMLGAQAHALRFVQADLETGPLPIGQYGFCADTMEHIPPDKVGAVLDNILAAARHCFFAISTTEDHAGQLIGETLHLSIHPYAWWLDQFKQRQCVIHWSDERNTTAFFHVSQWMSDEEFAALPAALTVEDEQAIAQVRENTAPSKGWQQVRPHVTNDMEVMILGGGPSLGDHVEEIRGLRMAGVKLVTLNGTYNWALEHGLTPSAQIVVDARAFNARFVQPVLDGDCKYLMASQVHPDVLAGLPKDRTWLWHTGSPLIKDILDEHYDGIWWPIPGGSTVLFRAIPLLRLLGYTRFHLFGCDSCLRDGTHHAYGQPENDASPILPVTLDLDGYPVAVTEAAEAGRIFYCHPSHLRQATEMTQLVRVLGDDIELAIYGDGLLAHILKTGAALNDGHSGAPDHQEG